MTATYLMEPEARTADLKMATEIFGGKALVAIAAARAACVLSVVRDPVTSAKSRMRQQHQSR